MALELGPYRLREKIADGGMAELFLASKQGAQGWERPVVVKRILPPFADNKIFRELIFSEASLVSRLSHPNIVHIYDYDEFAGYLCIVQEYIPGKNLAEVLKRYGGPLPWPVVSHIIFEVLKALDYLHSLPSPILHRDISPQNILLTYDGQVKLIDFGIARNAMTAEDQNLFKGKQRYLPPEYLERREYNVTSELYALGLVAAEALQFDQGNSGLPRDLVAWIVQSTTTEPAERFCSAEVMRQGLRQILGQHSETAGGATTHIGGLLQKLYPNEADRQHQPLNTTQVLTEAHVAALGGAGHRRTVLLLLLMLVSLLLLPRGLEQTNHGQRTTIVKEVMTQDIVPIVETKTTIVPIEHAAVKKVKRPQSVVVTHGFLTVDSQPWSSVYLNGKLIGVTPLKRFSLAAGNYQIFLVRKNGKKMAVPVIVHAGSETNLFKQLQ